MTTTTTMMMMMTTTTTMMMRLLHFTDLSVKAVGLIFLSSTTSSGIPVIVEVTELTKIDNRSLCP